MPNKMQPSPEVHTSLLKPKSIDVESQEADKWSEVENSEEKRNFEQKTRKDCIANVYNLDLSKNQSSQETCTYLQNEITVDVESQDDDALSKGETSEEEDEKQLFEQKTKKDFIAKVYAIFTLQLLPTFGIIFVLNYSAQAFMSDHFWIVWIFLVAQISLYCAIACCEGVQRSYLLNMILLNAHTLFFGLISAWISAHYGLTVIWLAFIATASIVTIFTKYSSRDVTGCQTYLFIGFLAVTVFTIIVLVVNIFIYISLLNAIISVILAFLYSLYLIDVYESMDIDA